MSILGDSQAAMQDLVIGPRKNEQRIFSAFSG